MVQVNDLRIGNYINSKLLGSNHKITGLLSDMLYTDLQLSYSNYVDWQPIELTEAILIKAGFKKDVDGCIMLPYCKDYSFYWLDTGFLQIAKGYAPLTNAPCKYAHQLQNLVYALTNVDLYIVW